ncbi:MAG: hypothetical protein ACOCZD_02485 [Haloferacaceae archaeon]
MAQDASADGGGVQSTTETQAHLFGEPSGNSATIETSGRVIRPFVSIPDAIVDETRIHVGSGEMSVRAGEGGEDNTGEYGTVANFGEVVDVRDEDVFDGGETSKFSLDYLRDMADGLVDGKVEKVTLAFGEAMPMKLEFERTIDGEVAYKGTYLVAPRIES